MTADERKIAQGVGRLTTGILVRTLKGRPGLEEALGANEHFLALQKGEIGRSTVAGLAKFIADKDPIEGMVTAVGEALNSGAAKQARSYLQDGDFAGLFTYLMSDEAATQQNPFAFASVTQAATALCGAPITCMYDLTNISGGIITKTGAYKGHDTDPERFASGRSLADEAPGTLGVWHSAKDGGGYGVACVAAHPVDGRGYVAIHEVKPIHKLEEDRKVVQMKKVAEEFGIDQLEGQSVLHADTQITIAPHSPTDKNVVGARIHKIGHSKLGPDCVAAYQLKAK